VVQVVLPSILADAAHGQQRFDVEAETLGDALRALPVADLLLDGRGELRPLAWVYVDGTDARERGGLACPLDGARQVRIVAAVAGG
jgi:molybdopterin converting factor small subunit